MNIFISPEKKSTDSSPSHPEKDLTQSYSRKISQSPTRNPEKTSHPPKKISTPPENSQTLPKKFQSLSTNLNLLSKNLNPSRKNVKERSQHLPKNVNLL